MQAPYRAVSKDLIVDWIWLPPKDLRLLIINELYKFYLKISKNLKTRKQETEEKTRMPGHKALRWVVESE